MTRGQTCDALAVDLGRLLPGVSAWEARVNASGVTIEGEAGGVRWQAIQCFDEPGVMLTARAAVPGGGAFACDGVGDDAAGALMTLRGRLAQVVSLIGGGPATLGRAAARGAAGDAGVDDEHPARVVSYGGKDMTIEPGPGAVHPEQQASVIIGAGGWVEVAVGPERDVFNVGQLRAGEVFYLSGWMLGVGERLEGRR